MSSSCNILRNTTSLHIFCEKNEFDKEAKVAYFFDKHRGVYKITYLYLSNRINDVVDNVCDSIRAAENLESIRITFPYTEKVCTNKILQTLGAHPKLKEILSTKMPFREGVGETIKTMLETTVSIQKLYLRDGLRGTILSENIEPLAQGLAKNSSVTDLALGLRDNKGNLVHLLNALKINTTLQKLSINYCNLRIPADLDCSGLSVNSTLRELSLTGNEIHGYGAANLFTALVLNSGLQKLFLDNNKIGCRDKVANKCAYNALAELIKINTTITTMSFAFIVNIPETHSISESLQVNNTLTELRLPECNLNTLELALPICQSLVNHPSLQFLDLTWSYLSGTPAKVLGQNLSTNTVLSTLVLDHCSLGSGGIQFIANGLASNSCLQSLSARFNAIEAPGTKSLCESLHHNTTLTKLSLLCNWFNDDGLQHFFPLLRQNSTLHSLMLFNSCFDRLRNRQAAIDSLLDAMRANYGVTELFIDCSTITTDQEPFIGIFNRNNTLYNLLLKSLNYLQDFHFDESLCEKRGLDDISQSPADVSSVGTPFKAMRLG